ncbi:hypothetical protein J7K19_06045, partial [bacterium]|nr:hypothetical protein [bacterium]
MKLKHHFAIFVSVLSFLLLNCDYFVDFEPPEVKIHSPASGEKAFGSVEIIVEASDNKKLHHVELYLDGRMVKKSWSGSFTYIWDLTETNRDVQHIIKAKAFDKEGNWSETEVKFFGYGKPPSSPTLLSPANGSVFADPTPRLDWSDVPLVHRYELQIDDNSNFYSPVLKDTSIKNSFYTVSTALADATYYWRVRARYTGGNWSNWSSVWKFTVDTTGPMAPNLISPANGTATNQNTPTFDWSDVSGAVEYQIQVAGNNTFSSPKIDRFGLTSSTYTTTSPFTDGTYYWRVRAKDNLNNWGGWSTVWSFTIDTQGPPVPNLISPANGSTTNDNTPTFDWDDITDAVEYQIQVDNNSNFSSPERNQVGLTTSTYTPTSSLSDGTYYWRVRAKDNLNNWGGWSTV